MKESNAALLKSRWISWGPVHPASGQLRVLFDTDGERLLEAKVDIGYVHRGIEKIAENRFFIGVIPMLEKICILDASNYDLGYVRAVEEIHRVDVPERARYIRVFMCELNRIASHLYWTALMAAVTGFYTILMWAINDRELLLDLGAEYTGQRVSYIYIIPGGVRQDLPRGFKGKAFEFLDYFEQRLKILHDTFFTNKLFQMRTKGVGVLKKEDALKLGAAGPTLRGSGLKIDVRKDDPYEVYGEMDFKIPTGERGDSYDRCMVRFHEMEQSTKIMRQALESIPDGPVKVRVPWVAPKGEALSRVEAARGEADFYLLTQRGSKPYRLKISTPSFKNLYLFSHISRGHLVADLPVLLFSLDPFPLDADR